MLLVRSFGRAVLSAAEAAMAGAIADAGARSGDLTRMKEGRDLRVRAQASGRREALGAALWLLWLVLPPAVGALPLGYALAAPLWLLPGRPLLPARRR